MITHSASEDPRSGLGPPLADDDPPLLPGVGGMDAERPRGRAVHRGLFPGREAHDQLVDPVGRELGVDRPGPSAGPLGVDPVDGGLVGLAARPENAGRLVAHERVAGDVGVGGAERGDERGVSVEEPLEERAVPGPWARISASLSPLSRVGEAWATWEPAQRCT